MAHSLPSAAPSPNTWVAMLPPVTATPASPLRANPENSQAEPFCVAVASNTKRLGPNIVGPDPAPGRGSPTHRLNQGILANHAILEAPRASRGTLAGVRRLRRPVQWPHRSCPPSRGLCIEPGHARRTALRIGRGRSRMAVKATLRSCHIIARPACAPPRHEWPRWSAPALGLRDPCSPPAAPAAPHRRRQRPPAGPPAPVR
jgi:hypothetical protein